MHFPPKKGIGFKEDLQFGNILYQCEMRVIFAVSEISTEAIDRESGHEPPLEAANHGFLCSL